MSNPDQVLLADDYPSHLETVAGIFKAFDFEVTAVSDGIIAVAMIETLERLRLVLTDFEMPGMNGVEVLRTIKKTGVLRALMSARIGTDRTFDESLRQQCQPDWLLAKPLTLSKMRELIARLRPK